MDDVLLLTASILLLALLAAGVLLRLKHFIIYEYERGLLFRQGKFVRLLEPGGYWLYTGWYSLSKVDMRLRATTIPGQEVLSADNVTLKVSLAANYRVNDPYQALVRSVNFHEALYLALQMQLRDLVGSQMIEDLLAGRKEINAQLLLNTRSQAEQLGLELLEAGIKDVMFPGELKNIFAQVVNARKEGLAALERARGEQAALRSLANAARLLEGNPLLLQLRILQALGSSTGNTLVLRLPGEGEAGIEMVAKAAQENPSKTPPAK